MWKIGHRGACGYAPENSLSSFLKALALDVDAVELDVHCSADGVVMVIHDATIDRTTIATGWVHLEQSTALQKLGIPTLNEVLDTLHPRCKINIELKTKAATLPTLSLLKQRTQANKNSITDFILSSFDWEILTQIATENPEFRLGVLYENDNRNVIAFAQNINAFSLHPDYKLLTFEKVKSFQELGFKVFPWTVNSVTEIAKLKSWQVDGIISDFPDRL